MYLLSFLGPMEMTILAVLGLLIFGRRLPSVARSLGASYNQFRAGLREEVPPPNHNKSIDAPAAETKSETEDDDSTATPK